MIAMARARPAFFFEKPTTTVEEKRPKVFRKLRYQFIIKNDEHKSYKEISADLGLWRKLSFAPCLIFFEILSTWKYNLARNKKKQPAAHVSMKTTSIKLQQINTYSHNLLCSDFCRTEKALNKQACYPINWRIQLYLFNPCKTLNWTKAT